MVGVAFFVGKKQGWYGSWQGEHQNGGKIIWRGNGGENPRKGRSQLSPCSDATQPGLLGAEVRSELEFVAKKLHKDTYMDHV